MIIMTNIWNVGKAEADEKYAIVRSLKHPVPGVTQLATLSPSSSLFFKYLDLKKQGKWNEESYLEIYQPQFIREMTGKAPASWLQALYQKDRKGMTVALACFCPDESLCHRRIIGDLLSAAGCSVRMECVPRPEIYEKWKTEYGMRNPI